MSEGEAQRGAGGGSQKKPEYVPPTKPLTPPKTAEEARAVAQAFARHNQKECERNFHITKKLSNLPENTNKERYCACVGKAVWELSANDPKGENARSSRAEVHYRSVALSQCRNSN
jgi:hypothetical protein